MSRLFMIFKLGRKLDVCYAQVNTNETKFLMVLPDFGTYYVFCEAKKSDNE